AVGLTLAYDAAELGDESAVPTEKAKRLTIPTLTLDGSDSYPFMHTAAVALSKLMPHGEQSTLQGQTHEVAPEALAPVLIEFFSS
nr:alpha/beta hydrolase [Anaerolineae bacterium]